MSKSRLSIFLILICLATSITFAQSFLSGDKQNTSQTSSAPKPAMTPEEFKNAVTQLDQQRKSALTNEYNAAVAKQPKPSLTNPTAGNANQPNAPAAPVTPPKPADTSSYSSQSGTPDAATPTFAQPQPTTNPPPHATAPSNPNSNSNDANKPWGIKY